MAAAILEEQSLGYEVEILARGMVVLFPEPLNQKAEAVMISNGSTLEDYRAKELDAEDIVEGTIIFTMSKEIREQVIAKFQYPHVFVLTDYVGDELEIMNPYGGNLQTYGLCYETLYKSLQKLADIINSGQGESNE
ncbi:MAG: phosphotyrosine protein phosphatase [Eubacterium sp.]|jgi:Protein-tyrosine-phosphatase|nr:phosphotyrosine protein phosphatase [Eubacterium sp.]